MNFYSSVEWCPNAYNGLGVGTTQLYPEQVVYNRKRHGKFTLAGRVYDFRMKPYFPKALSREFFLVDLANNVDKLAEHKKTVLDNVSELCTSLNTNALLKMAKQYGLVRTRKFFEQTLKTAGADLVRA